MRCLYTGGCLQDPSLLSDRAEQMSAWLLSCRERYEEGHRELWVPSMCLVVTNCMGVPTSGPHTQREISGAHSVLCGARKLWVYSTLSWGLCVCCSQRGELGDAREGSEAVGINWGDKGQRLDAQCISSVLVE